MRRAGVIVVVGALLMAIVLAWGGSGDRPTADPTPRPSGEPGETSAPGATDTPTPAGPAPAVAPVIVPLEDTLLIQRKVTLDITIPDPGEPFKNLVLRIYRDGEQAMDAVRVRGLAMTVKNIPLKRGQNELTMALANDNGEGPRSAPFVVTVDDRPPKIDIKEPDNGSVVNGSIATVRGVTDPGLYVTVRNPTSGSVAEILADPRGVFITEVRLEKAENHLEVSTQDAAGNRTVQPLTVVRGDGVPVARITISPLHLKLGELPTSVTVHLELTDPDGRPVSDATVVFSISPPGLPTDTYTTTTSADGIARWDGYVIAREGAGKGNGFVTARADLGPGISAAIATKAFTVE
jgi:hypothetical protein